MITLTESAGGVALSVKARPGGRKNAIVGEHAGALKVTVTAAPEKGKANEAIIEVLAMSLGLRKMDIELQRGASSSDKTFRIVGISRADLAERIAAALEDE